ncbi:uncharacterized protein [Musca autumnalis]|uniref:uncharacterized protein n=1 Tax=Musca autumnalis TaxID=221902 RepID=UPI003CF25131
MALCASRVVPLNQWNQKVMDQIVLSGEHYFRESRKEVAANESGFQLEDLADLCSMEGKPFNVCLKTMQQGRLFSEPTNGPANLAFALINFFVKQQFGILECFNRFLGFGYIPGRNGGYFMVDAQSMNFPVFYKHQSGVYMLRTNHLQILLYCLIVSLNVRHLKANFCIHKVDIKSTKSLGDISCRTFLQTKSKSSNKNKTSRGSSLGTQQSPCEQEPLDADNERCLANYQRVERPIPQLVVENCLVLPMADKSTEVSKQNNNFVKMICSETKVQLTEKEKAFRLEHSFVKKLPEALFWR